MRIPNPARSLSSIAQSSLSRYFFPKPPLPIYLPKPSSFSHFTIQMAGESENFTAAAEDDNVKYGFERSEMYSSSLAGTVDPPFQRHMFLCYKSHDSWPSRVEDSDSDPLPKLFASALKSRRNDIKSRTRFTICEGGDDLKMSDGDVLIFPEMILYRGLGESDVDSFVEDVLVSGQPWQSGVQEQLSGSYVFVCAHNNRDRRCGVCGPPLIDTFKEEIASKNLKDQVFVNACSHIGGHKYAGNVIIFSPDSDGKIAGNWYGYVTPNDVLELLDKQVLKGEVIERIWRGHMGAVVKEAEKVEEPKLSNGTTANNETGAKENTESVGGCCQGANGFSCCRDENVKKKAVNKEVGGCSAWMGKWEQRDVLTAAAVVAAVATVAVAYGFYRRSR